MTQCNESTRTSIESVGTFLKTSFKLRRTQTRSPWPSRIIDLPRQPSIPTARLNPKISARRTSRWTAEGSFFGHPAEHPCQLNSLLIRSWPRSSCIKSLLVEFLGITIIGVSSERSNFKAVAPSISCF
uniref:Uncharacterized protein n=1 Tax=Opuntia streptacantha TaxID=393608 RepID=A0A7C8ZVR3_OPUST